MLLPVRRGRFSQWFVGHVVGGTQRDPTEAFVELMVEDSSSRPLVFPDEILLKKI